MEEQAATESLVDTFFRNYAAVAGEAHLARDWNAAAQAAAEIAAAGSPSCVALAGLPPDIHSSLAERCRGRGIEVLEPPFPAAELPGLLDRVPVGITGCAFAIAETGTLVEVCTNDAVRLVSALPRTHIGIVDAAEMVPRLRDAGPRLHRLFTGHGHNVVVSFISGPSRTGDIEMRLTLGVHGPEKAHAILVTGGDHD